MFKLLKAFLITASISLTALPITNTVDKQLRGEKLTLTDYTTTVLFTSTMGTIGVFLLYGVERVEDNEED